MPSAQLARPLLNAVIAFALLTGGSLLLFAALLAADHPGFAGVPSPWALAADPAVRDVLSGVSEVTVAVLGVAITVVAILVELAATRFTPRISEMFLRDPVNGAVMGFFVITTVVVFWGAASLHMQPHPTGLALAMIGLISLSLLTVMPYFAYVFYFLTPDQVIASIRRRAVDGLRMARRGRVVDGQLRLLGGTEELGELALNALDNQDKAIAIEAVGALRDVALQSLAEKDSMPALWFGVSGPVRHDQDFVALHDDILRQVEARRTWVEMKVLRQYQAIFTAASQRLTDVAHMVAIHTRVLGEEALARRDGEMLRAVVRFLNTYLRASINKGDIRTAYNLLNEYRGLAERTLTEEDRELALELAEHFKYYGQISFQRQLAFILEVVAYDMCSLLELAHQRQWSGHDALLDIFLELDREPEDGGHHQESALRGVRKAQVKLATYYLVHDEARRARRIFADMRDETPARLRSIHDELGAITQAEYWEVSDRGINFDWLPDAQRARLADFFGWFDDARV